MFKHFDEYFLAIGFFQKLQISLNPETLEVLEAFRVDIHCFLTYFPKFYQIQKRSEFCKGSNFAALGVFLVAQSFLQKENPKIFEIFIFLA